jgi:hypothetical protein
MMIEHSELIKFLAYLLMLLSDVIAYTYTLLKIFRILCFSKITFDQLPLVNPYKWPISFFRVVTMPYFRLWSKLLPTLKFGKGSYDISTIIGLEALGSLISLSIHLRIMVFIEAQNLLGTISN